MIARLADIGKKVYIYYRLFLYFLADKDSQSRLRMWGNCELRICFRYLQKMGHFRKNYQKLLCSWKDSGCFLTGKTWNIPEHAERPDRINKRLPTTLLEILQTEMDGRLSGGSYHKVQIE